MYRLKFILAKNITISQENTTEVTLTQLTEKKKDQRPVCLHTKPPHRSESLATGIKSEISPTVCVCNVLQLQSKREHRIRKIGIEQASNSDLI